MDWTKVSLGILELLGRFDSAIAALAGGWFGWWLSSRSQRSEKKLTFLNEKIDALRQIKTEVNNGLPHLAGKELLEKLNADARLGQHALVRLFGLRTELIPHIEASLTHIIDEDLYPLYDRSERGQCSLKDDMKSKFVGVVEKLRSEIKRLEERYTKEYLDHHC